MPAHEYEDLARAALLEVTPENTVGGFVGTSEEGDGVVSLLFANRMPGYPGWRWTVSVAKVGDDDPTVLEVELMPGDGSLLAPDWVPWSERLAEYRAAQEDEDGDEDDDEDDDEDADYDDPDDDESDDDEDDDLDEDDLSESDDDDLDGVDVDELDEDDSGADGDDDDTDTDTDGDDDDDVSDGASDAELAEPVRSRGARRRARRVRPTDPDDDLEVDRLDPTEVDPDHHR